MVEVVRQTVEMRDATDWQRIVERERCEQCGLRASDIGRGELPGRLRDEGAQWRATLLAGSDIANRTRPSASRWSALESCAHVRDVLHHFRDRIALALATDDPAFGWWDHDAAVLDDGYNLQDPETVAAELAQWSELLADDLVGLDDAAWSRSGTRRPGERFSIEGLARFALHESVHHRRDALKAQRVALPAR